MGVTAIESETFDVASVAPCANSKSEESLITKDQPTRQNTRALSARAQWTARARPKGGRVVCLFVCVVCVAASDATASQHASGRYLTTSSTYFSWLPSRYSSSWSSTVSYLSSYVSPPSNSHYIFIYSQLCFFSSSISTSST